jgi:hypothetical protein
MNGITCLNWRSMKLKPEDVAFRWKRGVHVLSLQEKRLVNMVSAVHRTETPDASSKGAGTQKVK